MFSFGCCVADSGRDRGREGSYPSGTTNGSNNRRRLSAWDFWEDEWMSMATTEGISSKNNKNVVIRQGFLGKKSASRTRFGGVSFNLRWFTLTQTELIYALNDKEVIT